AKALHDQKQPVLVTVTKDGSLYLTLSGGKREAISDQDLETRVAAFVKENPQVSVLIGGDVDADYGKVYHAMVLLQQAGVPKVGLMSQPQPASNGHGSK
ncbi:MAG TPA: biopolymer transporter ExbD, partial [Rhodanobacteraceae bacterium]